MKKAIFVIAALLAAGGTARAQQAPAVTVSGSVTTGAQQVDSNTNSSKLTEYRDLRDGFFAPGIRLDMYDTRDGSFFDLGAANVSRADQSLSAAFGVINEWDVRIGWN